MGFRPIIMVSKCFPVLPALFLYYDFFSTSVSKHISIEKGIKKKNLPYTKSKWKDIFTKVKRVREKQREDTLSVKI